MAVQTVFFLLCVAIALSENDPTECTQSGSSAYNSDNDESLSLLQAKASKSPSPLRPVDSGKVWEQRVLDLTASIEKEKNRFSQSESDSSIQEESELDYAEESGGDPQWVLVTGHAKAAMSEDPYYTLLRADKEWAAQSLGMKFQHYWVEDLLSSAMHGYCKHQGCNGSASEKSRHFAKIFMVQEAMRTNPKSEFILWMDSAEAWFNPKVLDRFDNGHLMRNIAAAIPKDKHFIFVPLNHLNLGMFVVRNSEVGRKLVGEWADISSDPQQAPKCEPWDQAALHQLFFEKAAEHKKSKSEYDCRRSCQAGGCLQSFEEEIRALGLVKFQAGLSNSKVPYFHVLTAAEGVPRLQCHRCQTFDRAITYDTIGINTILSKDEDKLHSGIPWLTNHGGQGEAGRALFAKTSGLLQCDKPKRGGQPSAIVAGISKAGTTSIHMYLGEHPDVVLPDKKEVHFFDREERLHDFWQYVQHQVEIVKKEGSGYGGFRGRAKRMCQKYSDRFKKSSPGKMTLDSTPNYNFNPYASDWIRYMFPDMKLILSFRDPATRAYSEWRMWQMLTSEDAKDMDMPRDNFQTAAKYAIDKVQPCLAAYANKTTQSDKLTPPLKECVPRFYGEQDVTRGLYLMNLLPWLKNFPKEQVYVLRYEDLDKDTASEMKKMAEFLGLERNPKGFSGWDKVTETAYNTNHSANDTMGQPKTAILQQREEATADEVQGVADLCDFYSKENAYLATVMGMNFKWCGTNFGDEEQVSPEEAGKALCRGLTKAGCDSLLDSLKAQGWREPGPEPGFVATLWPESLESIMQIQTDATAVERGWFCPNFNGKRLLQHYKFDELRHHFGGRDSMLKDRLTVIPAWKSAYVRNGEAANSAITDVLKNQSAYSIELEDFAAKESYFSEMTDTRAFTFVRDPTAMARSGFVEMLDVLYKESEKPARGQHFGKDKKEKYMTALQTSEAKWTFIDIDPYKQPQEAFEAYLQDLARLKRERRLGLMLELPANSHVVPQWTRMLYDDSPKHRIAMDYLGKIEHLDADFGRAQAQLGVPLNARVQWPRFAEDVGIDSSLPSNALLHDIKLTAQVNHSIAEIYKEDFRCFGYPLPKTEDA